MDQHVGARVGVADGVLHLHAQRVGFGQRHLAGQLQVQLHVPVVAGDAGAQVMGAEHAGHATGQLVHVLAHVGVDLLVHQHADGFPGDADGAPQDVGGDAQAEQPVHLVPAQAGEHQRQQDAAVEQQVRAVVQGIGAHGGGVGDADDVPLEGQQRNGQHQRQQHHRDAQRLGAEGLRVADLLHRLHTHQHGAGSDEQRLGQARQGFRLAVAEMVVLVCRLQGETHRQKVEEGGGAVQQRVGQAGQQADRAAQPPGHGLGQHQGEGDREGGGGDLAQQAGVVFRCGHGCFGV